MNITAPIKLKAALLFVVFASNTVLGFACAVGVDKAFIKRIISHVGIVEATESTLSGHAVSKTDHHNEQKHREKDCRCNKEKDNCCNKKVVSFEQLDKTITQFITANFALPACELPAFLSLTTRIYSGTSITVLNYIFRNLHSPPEDIRVSIRSFQI
ncbi:MAG: hypothetical protein ABI863_00460 [Ginsengibacter sp.]